MNKLLAMADKEKRIQKFLAKFMLKGKLKSVKTFEKAIVIIVEDPHSATNNVFYDKKGYELELSKGKTFPEDRVHYLTSTNPRNSALVARGILAKAKGVTESPS